MIVDEAAQAKQINAHDKRWIQQPPPNGFLVLSSTLKADVGKRQRSGMETFLLKSRRLEAVQRWAAVKEKEDEVDWHVNIQQEI